MSHFDIVLSQDGLKIQIIRLVAIVAGGHKIGLNSDLGTFPPTSLSKSFPLISFVLRTSVQHVGAVLLTHNREISGSYM